MLQGMRFSMTAKAEHPRWEARGALGTSTSCFGRLRMDKVRIHSFAALQSEPYLREGDGLRTRTSASDPGPQLVSKRAC